MINLVQNSCGNTFFRAFDKKRNRKVRRGKGSLSNRRVFAQFSFITYNCSSIEVSKYSRNKITKKKKKHTKTPLWFSRNRTITLNWSPPSIPQTRGNFAEYLVCIHTQLHTPTLLWLLIRRASERKRKRKRERERERSVQLQKSVHRAVHARARDKAKASPCWTQCSRHTRAALSRKRRAPPPPSHPLERVHESLHHPPSRVSQCLWSLSVRRVVYQREGEKERERERVGWMRAKTQTSGFYASGPGWMHLLAQLQPVCAGSGLRCNWIE